MEHRNQLQTPQRDYHERIHVGIFYKDIIGTNQVLYHTDEALTTAARALYHGRRYQKPR